MHSQKKKEKKKANKTVKVKQTKTIVTNLLQFFPFTLFIYIYIYINRIIHCTYNVNLYCKYIKIGKCCTHLQNLYNFFFVNAYNICYFLCVYNVSLHYK